MGLAAAAALALGACGTSFGAQTNQQYQAGVGADLRKGPVQVYAALLVENTDGSATVSARLINTSGAPQSLSSVAVTDDAGNDLPVRSTRILLPLVEGVAASIGGREDGALFVATEGAEPGRYVTLTFSFSDAADVTIDAPVVARSEVYEDVVSGHSLTGEVENTPAAEEPSTDAE